MNSHETGLGLRALDPDELHTLNGGGFPFLPLLGLAAATQIIIDWDNFKNGLMGRPEEK